MVIIGIVLAITVFVLLITGVFSLTSFLLHYASAFALGLFVLLVLIPTILHFRHHREAWHIIACYVRLVLSGIVGLLLNLFLMALLGMELGVLTTMGIAVNFFFLVLILGGITMLLCEFARWHLFQRCLPEDAEM